MELTAMEVLKKHCHANDIWTTKKIIEAMEEYKSLAIIELVTAIGKAIKESGTELNTHP